MVAKKTVEAVQITAPSLMVALLKIKGNAPFVQNKFSNKAKQSIMATQIAGSQSKSKKVREARDFDADYEGAMHKSKEGWLGIPAPAFRSAMIDACRLVGFKMTFAKLSVFVLPDGFDVEDHTPLVKITKGKPTQHIGAVRNATGVVDLRSRPMWEPGWEAIVQVQYDTNQFSLTDVTNLMLRAGLQVGVGEGRPNSKSSHGMGWGTFDVEVERMMDAAD